MIFFFLSGTITTIGKYNTTYFGQIFTNWCAELSRLHELRWLTLSVYTIVQSLPRYSRKTWVVVGFSTSADDPLLQWFLVLSDP
jgi:hypothetical protein